MVTRHLLVFFLLLCCVRILPVRGGVKLPAFTLGADEAQAAPIPFLYQSRRLRRQINRPDIVQILRDLISAELEAGDHMRLSDLLESNGKMGKIYRLDTYLLLQIQRSYRDY